ncbi:MAG: hypothetical protein R3190_15200, partial [Thermoanaerobaculia bacterium]|nr:hypothetical protein [Thermoanaerobaculia bacterium]
FEVRDLGDFDAPVDFQDKEFENSVVTFFTHNETRVAWDYGLRPSPALLLELGAGVSYLDTSVGLGIDVDGELSDDEEELAEAPHDQLVPLARGAATVRLAERFEVSLSGSYGSLSSVEKLFDAVLRLRYRWPARWDLAVDYRRYERRLAAKSLYNDLVIEGPGVAVGYRF